MSMILDALRRGRGRHAPRPGRNAAQTDAVLQTLGYRHRAPASHAKRTTVPMYVAAGAALALVSWCAAVWTTRTTSTVDFPDTRASAPVSAPTPLTRAPAPAREEALPVAVPAAAGDTRAPDHPLPSRAAAAPVARNSGRDPSDSVAEASPSTQPIVRGARRREEPANAPAPPRAPTHTTLPEAGTNPVAVASVDDHFRRALIYQRQGDFENALFHYKQLLQRDDLNAEAHNNLGLLYQDKGLLDDAVKEFRRAMAIEPRYARARNNLGVVYLSQRKLDAAAAEFHAALGIDPANVESLVNLSTVEKDAGRPDEARAVLARALDLDSRNAEAHYNLALLEDQGGRRDEALVHYRAFLQYGAAGHPGLVGEVRKRVENLSKNP